MHALSRRSTVGTTHREASPLGKPRAAEPPVSRAWQALAYSPSPGVAVQRKCACDSSSGGSCESCEEEEPAPVQRKAEGGAETGAVPSVVHDVLGSSGQPLDESTRYWVEGRTALDFSEVRVHTDEHAARSADAVQALAYTSGHHVVFGRGQYAPETAAGRHLLGHELAHVAQQANGAAGVAPKSLDPPDHPRELEADRLADALVSGEPAAASWSAANTHGAAPVVSRVGSVRCTAGRHSAPANAQTLLEWAEMNAALACTSAGADLTLLQLDCMIGFGGSSGFQVPTTTRSQNYQARFGLPPAVRGGFRDRIGRGVFSTQGEALKEEASSLSARYSTIANHLLSAVDYRCIGSTTTWGDCEGHCRGRTATACEPNRIMLCPDYWTSYSATDRALLLIHEVAHLHFAPGHGHNFRHADCYASFASDASARGWVGNPACRP